MARMNNELFHFLRSRNIFKGWEPSAIASEKTEQRRIERNRARLVWVAKGFRTNPISKLKEIFGNGTYMRNKHGMLK